MTQENKYLLLQDLCARLPYGVKLQCGGVLIGEIHREIHQRYMKERCDTILYGITNVYDNCCAINARYDLTEVKPYLRPMSSMTEEERQEYGLILCDELSINRFDWLNAHHFDYRGLIEKGLAIAVQNNFYASN